MFNEDKRGRSPNSRALQSLSGCSPAACGGGGTQRPGRLRHVAAAGTPRPRAGRGKWRPGAAAASRERALRTLLLTCTYTHGTKTSQALLLAPVHTRRRQLARALPQRSPLPLAAASLGQAAILPLPLATAITRSAASASPRLARPRRPAELRLPLLIRRHLSSSAANSHGHGLKKRAVRHARLPQLPPPRPAARQPQSPLPEPSSAQRYPASTPRCYPAAAPGLARTTQVCLQFPAPKIFTLHKQTRIPA